MTEDKRKPGWENPEEEDWCLEEDCSENLSSIEKEEIDAKLPPTTEMVKGLAKDAMKTFRNIMKRKKVLVTEEVAQKRLNICMACDYKHLTQKNRLRCTECGCFMDIKAHLAASKCPKDFWIKDKKEENGT